MAERIDGRFELSARVTPANGITLIRLLATPVVLVAVLRFGPAWGTFLAWVALASTDFVDGWVARRQGITTSGAFLDPLADKFLVLGALVALAAGGQIGWWPLALIGGREVIISAYRSVLARQGISVPARPLGKAKTAAQDVAIAFLLLPVTGVGHAWLGRDLLWVAVVLAVVSGAQYLLDSRHAAVPPLSQALVEGGDGMSPS
ncbi:MAG: CDP-diacylglycerol--glycerol-3-phosphate 3-phosphatidyltransferase [Actinomycetota bacterium]|nr:CDP-diacylglycerol--glycerol-3-phosphate 3-phosphatidyltransferase [Actinomycetota bacterium]